MTGHRGLGGTPRPDALAAPFPYFGGKRKVADIIWRRLGNPETYVEPFAGSMAVLLARPFEHQWWERRETANDASGHIVNFYRAVTAAPGQVAIHANWPVSEADLTARHLELVTQQSDLANKLSVDPKFFDPELAGWWVWGISAWVGGEWCSGLGPLRREPQGPGVYRKMPMSAASHGGKGIHRTLGEPPENWVAPEVPDLDRAIYDRMLESFEAIAQRLRRVRILCGDWQRTTRSVIEPAKGSVTGVLLDPPYALSERRANLYGPEDKPKRQKKSEERTAGARDIHAEAMEWAVSRGNSENLRIAYCTYADDRDDERFLAEGWTAFSWTAAGGYGLQANRKARSNREREVVWFSPACLPDTEPEPKNGTSLPLEEAESSAERINEQQER